MNIKELLRGKNVLMGFSYSGTILKLCPALVQFFIIKSNVQAVQPTVTSIGTSVTREIAAVQAVISTVSGATKDPSNPLALPTTNDNINNTKGSPFLKSGSFKQALPK